MNTLFTLMFMLGMASPPLYYHRSPTPKRFPHAGHYILCAKSQQNKFYRLQLRKITIKRSKRGVNLLFKNL